MSHVTAIKDVVQLVVLLLFLYLLIGVLRKGGREHALTLLTNLPS